MPRKLSSLADRIKSEEVKLSPELLQFAYRLADNISKSSAHIEIWGYMSSPIVNRRVKEVQPLVRLLKEEAEQQLAEQLHMNKEQRIEHLTMTALQAHRNYIKHSEAAHGAVYLKAMSIINAMTGDNAPTEVHHMVSVSNAQLERMSHSERTEAYKRMMSGKLKLIDNQPNQGPTVIEGEVSTNTEGGDAAR